MRHRFPAVCVLAIAAAVTLAAQSPARTAWGDPDLQGVYTFATETPLQRPAALANKESYTEAELQQLEKQSQAKHEENIATNEHFSYNALWFVGDQGRLTGRTSLIVDPENGRMPPLTRGKRGAVGRQAPWDQHVGGP
jgi:hypothetical protein